MTDKVTRHAFNALEYQQMLERERSVVQSLHDRGVCLSNCLICKENEAKNSTSATLGATLGATLDSRGSKYGDYGYMATCAQRIKEAMGPRAHLTAVQRESLDLIATKIARIVCGDSNLPDSWHDIQGYAKLAEDRCAHPRTPDAGDWPPATS